MHEESNDRTVTDRGSNTTGVTYEVKGKTISIGEEHREVTRVATLKTP